MNIFIGHFEFLLVISSSHPVNHPANQPANHSVEMAGNGFSGGGVSRTYHYFGDGI